MWNQECPTQRWTSRSHPLRVRSVTRLRLACYSNKLHEAVFGQGACSYPGCVFILMFGSTPQSRSKRTISRCPWPAARCRGFQGKGPLSLTSAPWSMRTFAISDLFRLAAQSNGEPRALFLASVILSNSNKLCPTCMRLKIVLSSTVSQPDHFTSLIHLHQPSANRGYIIQGDVIFVEVPILGPYCEPVTDCTGIALTLLEQQHPELLSAIFESS